MIDVFKLLTFLWAVSFFNWVLSVVVALIVNDTKYMNISVVVMNVFALTLLTTRLAN